MKEQKIVVSGLGRIEYALATAVIVRHFGVGEIEILCSSTARLAARLAEVSAARVTYKEIIIAGVGLTGDLPLLEKTLEKLTSKGTVVTWISMIALPDEVPDSIREKITVHYEADGRLYRTAGKLFDVDCSFYDGIYDFSMKPRPKSGKNSGQVEYGDLIDATLYHMRNYQSSEHYEHAICHLARGDGANTWTEVEKQLIVTYYRSGHRELGGTSQQIQDLRDRIKKVAAHNVSRVLITGESGTGKETVALLLHNASSRASEPIVSFNCASVAQNLLEARFLGYKKGAFTGADSDKDGLFVMAQGGTLFLDEIGELPLEAQGILLRVLEEGRFFPMGSQVEVEVDVHVIAATNRNLREMVREGKFRQDLFYRLNVVQLSVPPLRERLDDMKDIANPRWWKLTKKHLTPEQIKELQAYDYPGNVRELFAILERAAIFGDTFTALIEDERLQNQTAAVSSAADYPDDFAKMRALHVRRVYERYGGNLLNATHALGMAMNTVRKYLAESGKVIG